MRVDGLEDGADDEDEGGEHEGFLAAEFIGEGPDDETCGEGAGLLETDGEGVDAGFVGGVVLEVSDEGFEG